LAEAPTFEGDVRIAMQRVRASLNSAPTAVHADPMRPQGMARQLGLDKNLAWKAARIITDDDQLTAVSRLPGRVGERTLIDALVKAHAPPPIIGELRTAMVAFDRLVELHAGDRETLLIMLTDLSHEARKHRDEHNRRLSFQGNSATWGVQVRMQLAAQFFAPAREPGSTALDFATICGFVGFRRMTVDPTPEIPRFDDMHMVAAAQLGCRSSDFRGYRVRLRYPPIPATFVFRYPLPERA